MTDVLSPLWCANEEPHPEHWGWNNFGGRDYCSGRFVPSLDPIGYGPEYEAAWARMLEKPWAHGLAPIHHGCFENGWRGALLAAADIAHEAGHDDAAHKILALAVYDESARVSI